jgi:hypothetical protein
LLGGAENDKIFNLSAPIFMIRVLAVIVVLLAVILAVHAGETNLRELSKRGSGKRGYTDAADSPTLLPTQAPSSEPTTATDEPTRLPTHLPTNAPNFVVSPQLPNTKSYFG